MDSAPLRDLGRALRGQVSRVIVGQDEAIDLLFVALVSAGHVLLEGPPGTGKTLLARAFAASLRLDFRRVQFTPDLMPGDLLGTNLFDFRTNTFTLTRGPIFADLLLADEINRTPPKTQAALLEAMQERTVTLDGTTHALPAGFLVVATQNPLENEGTYPLPEAQLDRFLFKVLIGYPQRDEERTLVRLHGQHTTTQDPAGLGVVPLCDLGFLRVARQAAQEVRMSEEVIHYIVDLVRATREHSALRYGASPRAATMMAAAARAVAALEGRDYVVPDDVKRLWKPLLRHRLVLAPSAEVDGVAVETVLEQVLQQTPAPR